MLNSDTSFCISYLIVTNYELNFAYAKYISSTLSITESNMSVLPGIFIECDEICSDVAHVSVSPTIGGVFAGAFVAGHMRRFVSGNIFCSILHVLLYGNIGWAGEVSIVIV